MLQKGQKTSLVQPGEKARRGRLPTMRINSTTQASFAAGFVTRCGHSTWTRPPTEGSLSRSPLRSNDIQRFLEYQTTCRWELRTTSMRRC